MIKFIEAAMIFAVFDVDINVGISEFEIISASVYPNPARDKIILYLDNGITRQGKLDIYSMDGKNVLHKNYYTPGSLINLSLNSGMYIVQFNESYKTYIAKLIID